MSIERSDVEKGRRYTTNIPSSLESQTSITSESRDCFVFQQFSQKLQRFMIDYSIKVSTKLPLSGK